MQWLQIGLVPSANGPKRHGKIGTNRIWDRPCWEHRQEWRNAGMVGLKSSLAVAAVLLASSASAQQSPMPEDLAWKLIEIGRVVDPPKTAALYAPMQQKEPYSGVKIERDVKYGTAERHLLDVFVPETDAGPRPVLIY